MPRHRLHGKRRAVLNMDALNLDEVFAFAIGWRPPISEAERNQCRWRTWPEFMADYAAVRGEYLNSDMGERPDGSPPFAEVLYQRWGLRGPV